MSSNNMKVGYILKRFPVFAQTFIVREVESLSKFGVQPVIFSIQKPTDSNFQEGFKQIEKEVIQVPAKARMSFEIIASALHGELPMRCLFAAPWWNAKMRPLKEALWIYPKLYKFKIEHVHSHFLGSATETQWWLKKIFNLSYSFTAHANDFLTEQNLQKKSEQLITDAKYVVAVSDYSKDFLTKYYPKANITRIYNGMSFELLRKESLSIPPQILSVGRLVEKKGFEILIDACKILDKKSIKYECHIIGDGPLQKALQKRIADLNLVNKVFLNGAKPQDYIREKLSIAAVFVLACVPEKNGGMDILPTVITEAMGARLPVVSTRLAGIPEMVVDCKTGYLVDPFDSNALADKIQGILENPSLGIELGNAGRERAECIFNDSTTIPKLIELFKS